MFRTRSKRNTKKWVGNAMTPDVVVDIGNTRFKWGHCHHGSITALVGLPDDVNAWQEQLTKWSIVSGSKWVLAGVHPERRDRLAQWLRDQSMTVEVITSHEQLPIEARVDEPSGVGIDRLLNGVAVAGHVHDGRQSIVIDAGTAVTVDAISGEGVFMGGAILPGVRLMARSLNDYTAKLPLVHLTEMVFPEPGRNTHDAIAVGICWALVGGVRELISEFSHDPSEPPNVFVTGGDAPLLLAVHPDAKLWTDCTLEGIRLAAESWS